MGVSVLRSDVCGGAPLRHKCGPTVRRRRLRSHRPPRRHRICAEAARCPGKGVRPVRTPLPFLGRRLATQRVPTFRGALLWYGVEICPPGGRPTPSTFPCRWACWPSHAASPIRPAFHTDGPPPSHRTIPSPFMQPSNCISSWATRREPSHRPRVRSTCQARLELHPPGPGRSGLLYALRERPVVDRDVPSSEEPWP
jgi:hypothetical protein